MVRYSRRFVSDSFRLNRWDVLFYRDRIVGQRTIGQRSCSFAVVEAPGDRLELIPVHFESGSMASDLDVGRLDLKWKRDWSSNLSMVRALQHAGLWDLVNNQRDIHINAMNPRMFGDHRCRTEDRLRLNGIPA